MSLLRLRSHNKPTNRRNKPQLKATRKRNSRSKGLRQPVMPGADGLRYPGGRSKKSTRTTSTTPRNTDGLTLPTDGPRATCVARTIHDLQEDGPQTTCNETQLLRQIESQTHKNKRRTGQALKREVNSSYPSMDLPNGLSS
jgi:hypothetical protein